MAVNYKALCAELVEKIDYTWGDIPKDVLDLMQRTRLALAQPEPVGAAMKRLLEAPIDNRGYVDLRERSQPEPVRPTDEEIEVACPFDSFHEPAEHHGWWSAIEWAEQHWGRPALTPK